jgi:hypothetical protein
MTRNGRRKAVSLGSAATGFCAGLIILDDPLKAADASSPTERQRVLDYYQTILLSRLNDKVNGRIIVVQRRLHEDDLPRHLIDSGQFEHLDLPAIAVEDSEIAIGHGQLKHRLKGEVLCREREPAEALERLRLEMGNFAFSTQYQQDPTPAEGTDFDWAGLVSMNSVTTNRGSSSLSCKAGTRPSRPSPPATSRWE